MKSMLHAIAWVPLITIIGLVDVHFGRIANRFPFWPEGASSWLAIVCINMTVILMALASGHPPGSNKTARLLITAGLFGITGSFGYVLLLGVKGAAH